MQRIRFFNDAVAMLLFSGVIFGLAGFSLAHMVLDPVSQQALLAYLPFAPVEWNYPVTFFFIFFLFSILLLVTMIAWLRIANSGNAKTYQIATLILWPQHLNIIIISAGVVVLRSFPDPLVVVMMILCYSLVTLGSFFTTAYNMRRIHPTTPLYQATTYALFVVIVSLVLAWLVFGLELLSAWYLAIDLSKYLV